MSMKVAPESLPEHSAWLKPMEFTLVNGLIGIPEARRMELILNPDELPFMWLRSIENRALNFVVIEPQGVIPGYAIELPDDDAASLDIASVDDTYVLNIVTLRTGAPDDATVNLMGPIVINRRTLLGRQIVIGNFADFSARHPLLNGAPAEAAQLG